MAPQRNIELHGRVVAAANAREVPSDLLAAEFSMEQHTSAATDYTYRGSCGWRDWMDDLLEEFTDDARYEVEELIAADEDFVVALLRIAGRGIHSGRPLEFRWAEVTWFRDGLATRSVGYTSGSEALAATAGCSPASGAPVGLRRTLSAA
jgi:ketosteroid isomerase-like protein